MWQFGLRAAMIAVLLVPTMANAQTITVLGAGTYSCGTWLKQENYRPMMLNWVLGFAAAMNVEAIGKTPTKDVDVLGGADANAVEAWITKYCTANPLEEMFKTSLALLWEIDHK